MRRSNPAPPALSLALAFALACGGGDAPKPREPLPNAAAPPSLTEPVQYGLSGVDWGCAACVDLQSYLVGAESERALKGDYQAYLLVDGDPKTAWCEGAPGPGIGEKARILLGKPLRIEAIGVFGGYFKSEALLAGNGRLKEARLTTSDGHSQILRFHDPTRPLSRDPSLGSQAPEIPPSAWFDWTLRAGPPLVGVPTAGLIEWVELEILEVYPGEKHEDTCVSEVALLLVDPDAE